MKFTLKIATAAILGASATGAFAQKGETVKIAWLDPLSGLMAAVGTNQLKTFQFLADRWKGLAADIERAEASLEKLNEQGFRRSPTYPYD